MLRPDSIQSILIKVAESVQLIKEKKSVYRHNSGFLSESDIVSHKTFQKEIHKLFPEDQIFSEEDHKDDFLKKCISEYYWVIDPICGTTNYLYDLPLFTHAVSVFKKKSIIAAGVYDPSRKEMFFSDGKNFFINEKKTTLDKSIKLSEALISINTNQSNFDNDNFALSTILSKIGPPISRRVHILESANLELAYVAAGRLDAYYNPTDKPWDIAAGQLFISSAKGAYKVCENADYNILKQNGILGANSESLLNELFDHLK